MSAGLRACRMPRGPALLRCVVLCCSVLQCVAVCFNALQCVAVLQYVAVCCGSIASIVPLVSRTDERADAQTHVCVGVCE